MYLFVLHAGSAECGLNRTGINSECLNDDKIGLLMDDIYKLGLTNLFIEIGLLVIKKFKIDTLKKDCIKVKKKIINN